MARNKSKQNTSKKNPHKLSIEEQIRIFANIIVERLQDDQRIGKLSLGEAKR